MENSSVILHLGWYHQSLPWFDSWYCLVQLTLFVVLLTEFDLLDTHQGD